MAAPDLFLSALGFGDESHPGQSPPPPSHGVVGFLTEAISACETVLHFHAPLLEPPLCFAVIGGEVMAITQWCQHLQKTGPLGSYLCEATVTRAVFGPARFHAKNAQVGLFAVWMGVATPGGLPMQILHTPAGASQEDVAKLKALFEENLSLPAKAVLSPLVTPGAADAYQYAYSDLMNPLKDMKVPEIEIPLGVEDSGPPSPSGKASGSGPYLGSPDPLEIDVYGPSWIGPAIPTPADLEPKPWVLPEEFAALLAATEVDWVPCGALVGALPQQRSALPQPVSFSILPYPGLADTAPPGRIARIGDEVVFVTYAGTGLPLNDATGPTWRMSVRRGFMVPGVASPINTMAHLPSEPVSFLVKRPRPLWRPAERKLEFE